MPRGRVLLTLVGVPLLLYGVAVGAVYLRQESLLFFPTPLAAEYRFRQSGVEERFVEVDGARLHALHFRQPGAKGVVFFLHGNAGNNDSWLTDTSFYRRTGYDLFLLDYRGYGKSTGRISSEAQLHADVMAAWQSIAPEYAGRRKIVYGRSLGTGPATRLATQVDADLLVLVSPYSSVRELAAEHFAWVPGALLRYPLPTREWLPAVKMPVLLIHGEQDEIVPVTHAARLHALRPDAELLLLPGVHHNDVHLAPRYIERLEARLAALR
ncbi:MAG TPA: alpha/beta fold hydrolase [Burkholderiaceae bacterium]|nr:alpha/beta fold hydrolase [Burkholderiaceae bacterium]